MNRNDVKESVIKLWNALPEKEQVEVVGLLVWLLPEEEQADFIDVLIWKLKQAYKPTAADSSSRRACNSEGVVGPS